MSAPTDERTNEKKERKLRCTDLNMRETTNSKLPTQTGLPKINFKLKQKKIKRLLSQRVLKITSR